MRHQHHQRFAQASDVIYRVLDGEAVLLDLASGKYFGLNEVGTRVWEMIGEGRAVLDLQRALLGEFDVAESTLETDLAELLDTMLERRLIVALGAPDRP